MLALQPDIELVLRAGYSRQRIRASAEKENHLPSNEAIITETSIPPSAITYQLDHRDREPSFTINLIELINLTTTYLVNLIELIILSTPCLSLYLSSKDYSLASYLLLATCIVGKHHLPSLGNIIYRRWETSSLVVGNTSYRCIYRVGLFISYLLLAMRIVGKHYLSLGNIIYRRWDCFLHLPANHVSNHSGNIRDTIDDGCGSCQT